MRELEEELKTKEEEWRQRQEKVKLKHEMELQEAEERRRQEQHRREEEWVGRLQGEKRTFEEAHHQAVKKWAEKEAVLNSEVSLLIQVDLIRCKQG